MIIVSDTTTLSNFIQIQRLEILHELYGKIIIPPSVYEELMALRSFGIADNEILNTNLLEIQQPQSEEQVEALLDGLDRGESEAIVLAQEINADYLLIDEVLGRKIAETLGIPLIGTLGVLLKAKEIGLIPSVKSEMHKLKSIGFWISETLFQSVLLQVDEKG